MLNPIEELISCASKARASSPDTAAAIPQNSPNFPTAENALLKKQQAAVKMLALGQNYGEICKNLQIDRKTLYNWRKRELFAQATDARRRELWKDAADRLSRLVHPALDTMEEFLMDVYDKNRMRAATSLLRLSNLGKSLPRLNDQEEAE